MKDQFGHEGNRIFSEFLLPGFRSGADMRVDIKEEGDLSKRCYGLHAELAQDVRLFAAG